jgi:hypothetical protein
MSLLAASQCGLREVCGGVDEGTRAVERTM